MKKAKFVDQVTITSTDELDYYFPQSEAILDEGAKLSLFGSILLGKGVIFRGNCDLKGDNIIDTGTIISNTQLGHGNVIRAYSIIENLYGGNHNIFGPFCFLRDSCEVHDDCILGSHVEATRSRFSKGVKVSHRAFIGDADIGDKVTIGAGVVFCNWDGAKNQPSIIQNDTVVGSGCLLVAPINIGANVIIAAGCTITKDISSDQKIIQKIHLMDKT